MDAALKNLINKEDLTHTQKVLLILDVGKSAMSISAIRATGIRLGLRQIKKWNISSLLGACSPRAIRTDAGWELTNAGRDEIHSLTGSSAAVAATASNVRSHLTKISSSDTREFLEEAIICFDHKHFRAATVLSWVGAVDIMYEHVFKTRLKIFNTEARRRHPKWKEARSKDDLALVGEHEFLDILEAISVIGKSVKQELQNNCLKLRNACGHPNSFKITENRVAAHLDTLILNVFSPFS